MKGSLTSVEFVTRRRCMSDLAGGDLHLFLLLSLANKSTPPFFKESPAGGGGRGGGQGGGWSTDSDDVLREETCRNIQAIK